VHIQLLVPWLVSSLVANGLRMIMKNHAMLSVRNRESIRLAYRKMSWWWLHAAAITGKLIRNVAWWPALCRIEDQNSDAVSPVGTGRSMANSVMAMATTASEKKISRSTPRASTSRSPSDATALTLLPRPGRPVTPVPGAQFHPTLRSNVQPGRKIRVGSPGTADFD
jgi:hypothetical protein